MEIKPALILRVSDYYRQPDQIPVVIVPTLLEHLLNCGRIEFHLQQKRIESNAT